MEGKVRRFNEAYDYLEWRKIIRVQEDVARAMGSTQANVSSALNGKPNVLTNRFIIRFCKAFPNIFNLSYILTGEGQLLAENTQKRPEQLSPGQKQPTEPPPNQADEHTAELSIIELTASLIKENEALRRQLKDTLDEVRSLRIEMSRDRDTLSTLRSSLSKLLYRTSSEPLILKAAENQEL